MRSNYNDHTTIVVDEANHHNSEISPIISRTDSSIRFHTPRSSLVVENQRVWLSIWNSMLEFMNVSRRCTFHPSVHPLRPAGLSSTTRTHLPRAASLLTPSTRLKLLDLPTEVLKLIFEQVFEPYVLYAYCWEFQRKLHKEVHILFHQPRDWAHMNVFRVCKAFREVAIECYGKPQYNTVPFDPCRDSVSIKIRDKVIDNPQGPRKEYWHTHDHILIQAKSPQYKEIIRGHDLWDTTNSPFDNSVDGVFIFRGYLYSMQHSSKLVRFSPEMASRINEVEILADQTWFPIAWKNVLDTVERYLTNIRYLRFKVPRPDSCVSSLVVHRLGCGSWRDGNRPERWANRFWVVHYPPTRGVYWPTIKPREPRTVRRTLEAATALPSGPNIIHAYTRVMLQDIWRWLNPEMHLSNNPDEAVSPGLITKSKRLQQLEVLELSIDRNVCSRGEEAHLFLNQPQQDGKPRWETWVEL